MIDDYINTLDQFSIPDPRNSLIVTVSELVYAVCNNFADDTCSRSLYGKREEAFPLDFFSEGLALFTYYYG